MSGVADEVRARLLTGGQLCAPTFIGGSTCHGRGLCHIYHYGIDVNTKNEIIACPLCGSAFHSLALNGLSNGWADVKYTCGTCLSICSSYVDGTRGNRITTIVVGGDCDRRYDEREDII